MKCVTAKFTSDYLNYFWAQIILALQTQRINLPSLRVKRSNPATFLDHFVRHCCMKIRNTPLLSCPHPLLSFLAQRESIKHRQTMPNSVICTPACPGITLRGGGIAKKLISSLRAKRGNPDKVTFPGLLQSLRSIAKHCCVDRKMYARSFFLVASALSFVIPAQAGIHSLWALHDIIALIIVSKIQLNVLKSRFFLGSMDPPLRGDDKNGDRRSKKLVFFGSTQQCPIAMTPLSAYEHYCMKIGHTPLLSYPHPLLSFLAQRESIKHRQTMPNSVICPPACPGITLKEGGIAKKLISSLRAKRGNPDKVTFPGLLQSLRSIAKHCCVDRNMYARSFFLVTSALSFVIPAQAGIHSLWALHDIIALIIVSKIQLNVLKSRFFLGSMDPPLRGDDKNGDRRSKKLVFFGSTQQCPIAMTPLSAYEHYYMKIRHTPLLSFPHPLLSFLAQRESIKHRQTMPNSVICTPVCPGITLRGGGIAKKLISTLRVTRSNPDNVESQACDGIFKVVATPLPFPRGIIAWIFILRHCIYLPIQRSRAHLIRKLSFLISLPPGTRSSLDSYLDSYAMQVILFSTHAPCLRRNDKGEY